MKRDTRNRLNGQDAQRRMDLIRGARANGCSYATIAGMVGIPIRSVRIIDGMALARVRKSN